MVNYQGKPERVIFEEQLDMQMHCGFWGFVIAVLWSFLIFLGYKFGSGVDLPLMVYGVVAVIALAYLATAWITLLNRKKILDGDDAGSEEVVTDHSIRAKRARKALFRRSAIYIVLTVALMWATGGAQSFIVVFYTMTYTLTLSKIRVENYELKLLFAFLAPLFVVLMAFVLQSIELIRFGTLIEKDLLNELLLDPTQQVLLAIGACVSLVIPTLSVRGANKRRGKAREIRKQV
jgi:hypothetical protein